MTEKWRDIPEHPGYQASDLGRVRSVDRQLRYADGRVQRHRGRLLRQYVKASGHLCVSLGRYVMRDVHTLVLRAFVGPPPEKHECLHGDHDPTNNKLTNLRWGTRSENIRMDFEAGRRPRQHLNFGRAGPA